jgi:dipeptide transport system ATP-binding protein
MGMSILQADNLKRFYTVKTGLNQKTTVKALNGASFSLEAGKTLAVVGESGCGKSTLARLLTFIEEPTEGNMVVGGQSLADMSDSTIKEMRQQVQMVFQDPYGSLNPRKTVGSILEEPLIINRQMSASERRKKVAAMLEKVGLRAEHVRRYPHMFSGGQRQRIAIARAMMLEPKIIVADEPVSALDVSIQAQVLNLMMDLQAETGVSYVFISHGLSVVEHIADNVMVMYFGHPVEVAPKAQLFTDPKHPYTQALLSATPFVDPTYRAKQIKISGELPSPLNPPSGCAFHKRCPLATASCREQSPELRALKDGRQIACFEAADF